jgi:hypothetical protein
MSRNLTQLSCVLWLSLSWTSIEMSNVLRFYLKIQLGKASSSLSHSRGCWQNSVLQGLLTWGPLFLAGCWLEAILVPYHVVLPNMVASFTKSRKPWRLAKWKSQSVYPNYGGGTHHLCFVLLIRGKSQVLLVPKRRDSHKDMNTKKRKWHEPPAPCSPSHQEDGSLKPAWGNSSQDPLISTKPMTKKGW